MPDYRNNYQSGRPAQRPPQGGGRYPYDARPQRPAGDRRTGGGYVGERRRPVQDMGYSRRPMGGEYLADSRDDRYAERPEQKPARTVSRPAPSVSFDDDFDDLELDDLDFDDSDLDEPEFDDFDDFDDLDDFEDIQQQWESDRRSASERRSRRDDDWYGENDAFGSRRAAPHPQKQTSADPATKRKMAIVITCGILAIGVAIFAAVALLSSRSAVMMPLETVLKNITLEQSELMVDAYADRKLSSTICNVNMDGNAMSINLADCEMSFAGFDTDRKTTYVTGTDDATGELVRMEYVVDGVFRYNKTALRAALDSLLEEGAAPVVDPWFEIDYENGIMTVHAGSDGWGIDMDLFLSQLCSSLMGTSGDIVSLRCTGAAVSAQPLSAAEIYKQAATRPADAYTTTDSAGQTIYHSEINGVEFDQSQLEQLIASGGTEWEIPVSVTFPETNLKDIKKYTFPDVLASYYTKYNSNAVDRSHNLSLAAEHINSLILEPGEQFSFNDTVGERTAANGFRKAGVYAGEGTSEDYGGGICQTSSTLYYTCILANLQIDERRNHMYTVGYMQTAKGRNTVYGNDATVNWGYTDYKFTNNKEYPIRIDIWAEDGILTCEIRGTADGYTADFAYVTQETMPYMIKYLPDNGSDNQAGQAGYKVNVYRIVYKDGEEIGRELESKNTYKPMTRIYYTNDLPAGFEYGVEYDRNYTPPVSGADTSSET